jgi:hypothetical protein
MLVFASKVVYQELEKDFERLKKKETYQKEELKALTDILHHTHDLHQNELTKNKIDVLEQDIKRIPGQPSIGKKLLGAVAVLFGVLLIATSPLTAPYTLGLGFVAGFHIGYHIMMMGMILFGGAAALTGGYFFIQRNELATVTHRLKNVANRELKLKP